MVGRFPLFFDAESDSDSDSQHDFTRKLCMHASVVSLLYIPPLALLDRTVSIPRSCPFHRSFFPFPLSLSLLHIDSCLPGISPVMARHDPSSHLVPLCEIILPRLHVLMIMDRDS